MADLTQSGHWRKRMKVWYITLILILMAAVLAGCGRGAEAPADAASSAETAPPVATSSFSDDTLSGDDASSAVEPVSSAGTPEAASAGREQYTSAELDTSYEGALPASSQLALGIVQLHGTENAVTPEQAKSLLPLWQVIQSGSLQSDAETNAVVKQIEGTMTAEQVSAIADMQLTFEDMGAWMQERGLGFGGPQGGEGGRGAFGDLTEDERAAMRATRQAGGEGGFGAGGEVGFGSGGFANMTEDERASLRATAEAGGMAFGRPGGGGRGQLSLMAEQVVELLTGLAGE
jgi:hypothetical protein